MAFNKDLDKQLANVVIETATGELHVGRYSYNEGEEKIQIGPRYFEKKDGGMTFRKVGRLSLDEAEAVRDALNELLDKNNDN